MLFVACPLLDTIHACIMQTGWMQLHQVFVLNRTFQGQKSVQFRSFHSISSPEEDLVAPFLPPHLPLSLSVLLSVCTSELINQSFITMRGLAAASYSQQAMCSSCHGFLY